MDPKLQLKKDMGQPIEQPDQYRKIVGALIHLTNCTRPDISFSVNVLARYNQHPRESHKTAAIDLLHSCWRASFLAFCLGRRPAKYTIYIPYISFIYSMYIYNYIHIWQAARNVKNSPANNYGSKSTGFHREGGFADLKLFRPTLRRWKVRASSCELTESLP